jgi:penicillin-binding protein 1C
LWWFVDGQQVAETTAESAFDYSFSRIGGYQLSVLDEAGQTAQVKFSLIN